MKIRKFHVFLDVETLMNSLSQNSSLILLDLSHNKLSKNIGTLIGKIMSNHCEKRNEVVWMHSLRGELPAEDLSLKGSYTWFFANILGYL